MAPNFPEPSRIRLAGESRARTVPCRDLSVETHRHDQGRVWLHRLWLSLSLDYNFLERVTPARREGRETCRLFSSGCIRVVEMA